MAGSLWEVSSGNLPNRAGYAPSPFRASAGASRATATGMRPAVVLPTDLLPTRLGLAWGLSRGACIRQLNTVPVEQSRRYAVVRAARGDGVLELKLLFDASGHLCRIRADLHVSRDFWEPEAKDFEAMERIEREYRAIYTRLKEEFIERCGPPSFTGSWEDSGFPEDELATLLTCWDFPEGRVHLAYDHPDKELPVFITLASYQLPARPPAPRPERLGLGAR